MCKKVNRKLHHDKCKNNGTSCCKNLLNFLRIEKIFENKYCKKIIEHVLRNFEENNKQEKLKYL